MFPGYPHSEVYCEYISMQLHFGIWLTAAGSIIVAQEVCLYKKMNEITIIFSPSSDSTFEKSTDFGPDCPCIDLSEVHKAIPVLG